MSKTLFIELIASTKTNSSFQLASRSIFELLVDYLSPKYGMVLLVDVRSGRILKSLQDPSGTHLSSISQVSEVHCKFLKVLAYVESISPQVLRATGG